MIKLGEEKLEIRVLKNRSLARLILFASLLLIQTRFGSIRAFGLEFGRNKMDEGNIKKLASALPHQISGWNESGQDLVFGRDNIFDYMDGAGEIYLAFDFKHLFVREYTKENSSSLVVEIYEMSSSEDAYGVYTQDTDGDEIRIGQDAVYAAGLLRFWKDKVFVRVMAEKETAETKAAVLKIGEIVAQSITKEGKRPDLLDFLPPSGLISKSIRFFHKTVSLNSHYYLASSNILNLSEKTDALLARYETEKSKPWLFLVRYKTSARTKAAHLQFLRIYFKERSSPAGQIQVKKLETGKFSSTSRRGRLLVLVFEANSASDCERLSRGVSKKTEEKK